jgi:hypothetical protein
MVSSSMTPGPHLPVTKVQKCCEDRGRVFAAWDEVDVVCSCLRLYVNQRWPNNRYRLLILERGGCNHRPRCGDLGPQDRSPRTTDASRWHPEVRLSARKLDLDHAGQRKYLIP